MNNYHNIFTSWRSPLHPLCMVALLAILPAMLGSDGCDGKESYRRGKAAGVDEGYDRGWSDGIQHGYIVGHKDGTGQLPPDPDHALADKPDWKANLAKVAMAIAAGEVAILLILALVQLFRRAADKAQMVGKIFTIGLTCLLALYIELVVVTGSALLSPILLSPRHETAIVRLLMFLGVIMGVFIIVGLAMDFISRKSTNAMLDAVGVFVATVVFIYAGYAAYIIWHTPHIYQLFGFDLLVGISLGGFLELARRFLSGNKLLSFGAQE